MYRKKLIQRKTFQLQCLLLVLDFQKNNLKKKPLRNAVTGNCSTAILPCIARHEAVLKPTNQIFQALHLV